MCDNIFNVISLGDCKNTGKIKGLTDKITSMMTSLKNENDEEIAQSAVSIQKANIKITGIPGVPVPVFKCPVEITLSSSQKQKIVSNISAKTQADLQAAITTELTNDFNNSAVNGVGAALSSSVQTLLTTEMTNRLKSSIDRIVSSVVTVDIFQSQVSDQELNLTIETGVFEGDSCTFGIMSTQEMQATSIVSNLLAAFLKDEDYSKIYNAAHQSQESGLSTKWIAIIIGAVAGLIAIGGAIFIIYYLVKNRGGGAGARTVPAREPGGMEMATITPQAGTPLKAGISPEVLASVLARAPK